MQQGQLAYCEGGNTQWVGTRKHWAESKEKVPSPNNNTNKKQHQHQYHVW